MLILTLSNRIRISLVALLVCMPALTLLPAPVRAQQKSAEEIDRQAEAMLGKLTLEQKIDLIHGANGMFNPPMPQFGLPALKPSDGPMGVKSWGPPPPTPSGLDWRHHGTRSWRSASGYRWARTPGRAGCTSSWARASTSIARR